MFLRILISNSVSWVSFFRLIKSPISSPNSSWGVTPMVAIVGTPFPLRIRILGAFIFTVVSGNTILASCKTTLSFMSLAKRLLYL